MKRILVLLVLLFSIPAFAYEDWQATGTVTSGQTTGDITLPDGVGEGAWMIVPTLTSSTVALSGSLDGTNFGTIYSYNNGASLTNWITGTVTGVVLFLPDIRCFRKLRVTIASQGADKAFTIYGKRRNN